MKTMKKKTNKQKAKLEILNIVYILPLNANCVKKKINKINNK